MLVPRLIEVALPIREISAESVRDKSLRHGHISTLHLWWARRPLAAARAVVFASLLPDPDDPDCPPAFIDAVLDLLQYKVPDELKGYKRGRKFHRDPDPYKPYKGIPDTARNRLLAFIAKWSPEMIAFESGASEVKPAPSLLLDDRCLVKWETSAPDNEQGREVLRIARELVHLAYDGKTPTVLDPFAGGGAIPLEAGRIGAQAIANDYNPVAALVLRATCEFPQRYGKPGMRAVEGHIEEQTQVANVLVHDVEYWAKWILDRVRKDLEPLYPPGRDNKPVIGYIWARTAPCSNPTCRAEIPLIHDLLLCNRSTKRVALTLDVRGKTICFGIARGSAIERTEGTMLNRGDCRCPICTQSTPVKDLRRAGLEGKMRERLVAVITQGPDDKEYRPVEPADTKAVENAKMLANDLIPLEEPVSTEHRPTVYGFLTHGALYNERQLVVMDEFIRSLHEAQHEIEKAGYDSEYRCALLTYLSLWVSRTSMFMTSFGAWKSSGEFIASPFGVQRIPMVWDYVEVPLFSKSTGGARSQLDWIIRVIKHESPVSRKSSLPVECARGDAAKMPKQDHLCDVIVTDPPYFDEMAYADLSDSFYVWLKRCMGDILPEVFSTPLTPKEDEATALAKRHGGAANADAHFQNKLAACFTEAHRLLKPGGVISVMFAHQTTHAWVALVNALFRAGLNIHATLPIDTERANRVVALDASALASSITVVCRPRQVGAAASFRDMRKEIDRVVQESVHRFWDYGFRGADLIVACYGPAVGVFGKYERVEKDDGTPVDVPALLDGCSNDFWRCPVR